MEIVATTVPTDVSPLSSPAFLAVAHGPVARQLLFVDEVLARDGTGLDRASLSLWRVDLHVEALGRFELLAYGVPCDPNPIPVTISAPGNTPAEVHIVIDDAARRLADGTPGLLYDFVLDGGDFALASGEPR